MVRKFLTNLHREFHSRPQVEHFYKPPGSCALLSRTWLMTLTSPDILLLVPTCVPGASKVVVLCSQTLKSLLDVLPIETKFQIIMDKSGDPSMRTIKEIDDNSQ